MALYDLTRSNAPRMPLAGLLGRLIAWYDRRTTGRQLAKLTDRELNDIGLSRGDVANWDRRDR